MNRGNRGFQRGSRARGDFRGGRGGNRTYSGSSGSSSGQNNHNRPILRTSYIAASGTPPSDHLSRCPARIDSARLDSPVTPIKEQSSFTMNGHTISETYTPSGNSISSSPRPYGSPTSTKRNYGGNILGYRAATQRPTTRNGEMRWADNQEHTIRILGVPRTCWTKEVYEAMSRYGNVARIEIRAGAPERNTLVTFQPPPQSDIPQQVIVGQARVRWESYNFSPRTVPSPVNPNKNYNELNVLFANSIDFGAKDGKMSVVVMHTVHAPEKVQLKLDLARKELDIQFPLKLGDETRKFRFRLPIAHLSRIYKDANSVPGQTALIIPFESPPQFFVQKHEGEQLLSGRTYTSFSKSERKWSDWSTWFREIDVVDTGFKSTMQKLPLMDNKDIPVIDIGRWTTYRLFLDDAIPVKPQFEEFVSALSDHGIEIEDCYDYIIKDRTTPPLWALLQEEISGTHPHLASSAKDFGFDELFADQIHLAFPVRYQLEACLSNGYIKEHNITNDFLEILASMDQDQAIYALEKVVDKQHVYYNPMDIFKIRARGKVEKQVPSYCTLQRSAIITPTMVHVASPIMETSNRITRKYAADSDRFIRIKFSDEKTEGVLRNMPNERAEVLFDRVRRAMKNGIVVAGRFYEFLAFGNSQFREHGAYFYAPTSSKSADDIRLSLGHFDHIKTVAKFGARLGQCFSTTRAMRVTVKIVKIPDVERNTYCFTDGVGKLSFFLAQMAAQELGLPNAFDDPPSLFQFRLGGCKGVLALDPKLTGSEVHIRPSQQKFAADFTGLEIIRSSALATPFFNRQIIIVLSGLGVPNHVLIRKQQDMVNDYEQAMTHEEVAIKKLRKHIDMNQTTLTMAGMVLDGFMKSRDPFMMSLLRLWRASTIKNLKEKARIAIEDGAFVLGCVDETAILKGHLNDPQSRLDALREEKLATLPEIFLQIDDTVSNKKGYYKIIEGICVLARNPSLHPGDLRIVRAVNVPALHHLKNVVVLPQTGDRDLANMCSGGDLDGDDYMVLWDADLIPEIINVPPMDFTSEKPTEKDDPITVADISDFFVTYMQNDSLGQIAHAHLAQADRHSIQDDTCLELAKLHSQAVDYPKSGIPARMSPDLRPNIWPHFMEKKYIHSRKIYKSGNILGMLYDQVQLVDFKPQWENPFDKRVLKAFANISQSVLDKAAEIKISYDESLKRLMAKHGIRTEFEAWSVFVLGHNHESRDYKFAEEFGRTIGAMKAQFRETCRSAAQMTNEGGKTLANPTTPASWSHLGQFVAAMYTVTAREMEAALKDCQSGKTKIVGGQELPARLMDSEHMPLISFPWLFASELGKIATGGARPVESFQTQVALHHRKKKHSDIEKSTDISLGTVETEAGVTHYGELLRLDFGVLSTPRSPGSLQTSDLARNRKLREQKESPSNTSATPQVPRSLPVIGPCSWKQNVGESTPSKPVEGGSDTDTQKNGQRKQQQEGEQTIEGQHNSSYAIKHDTKRPAALNKLLRLGEDSVAD